MEWNSIPWDCHCCVAYSTLDLDAMMSSTMLVRRSICGKSRTAKARYRSQVGKRYVIR